MQSQTTTRYTIAIILLRTHVRTISHDLTLIRQTGLDRRSLTNTYAIFFLHLHVDSYDRSSQTARMSLSDRTRLRPADLIWWKIWNNSTRCRRTVGAHHARRMHGPAPVPFCCCVLSTHAWAGMGRQVPHDAVKRNSIFYPPMPPSHQCLAGVREFAPIRFGTNPLVCFSPVNPRRLVLRREMM